MKKFLTFVMALAFFVPFAKIEYLFSIYYASRVF